jgi:hypothetical protein
MLLFILEYKKIDTMERMNNLVRFIAIFLFCGLCNTGYGQVGVNTTSPTKTLDVNGDMRIRSLPTSAPQGYKLVVVDASGNVSAEVLYKLGNTIGDIKKGFQKADHNGWYLLNGRALTSLPAVAQASAAALGITGNLANATGKFLKGKTGSEALGSSGGADSKTIAQANLPNYNFTGTTAAGGAHNHTVTDTYWQDSGYYVATYAAANYVLGRNTSQTRTTSSNGDHTHTFSVNSGGSAAAFSIIPQNITVNTFIYLGN